MDQTIICPFTSKALQSLGDAELTAINNRIDRGELFFQSGVPLGFKLTKAFMSSNRLYIYAELDGILLMQKQTAIVERNLTANPLKRTSESDITNFYQNLGLRKDGGFLATQAQLPDEPNLSEAEWRHLFSMLNKQGRCLVTATTARVDELHNLSFGTNYQSHIHIDHNINRLRCVNGKLGTNTHYALCDVDVMPFDEKCVDGYFSFNSFGAESKELQKEIYTSLKLVLKSGTNAICLVDANNKNHAQAQYKSDVLSGKLKPWKKQSLPQFYFYSSDYSTKGKSATISGKRSFGSQFSKA